MASTDYLPEWLKGQTRNLMGSPRAGSNPAVVDLLPLSLLTLNLNFQFMAFMQRTRSQQPSLAEKVPRQQSQEQRPQAMAGRAV